MGHGDTGSYLFGQHDLKGGHGRHMHKEVEEVGAAAVAWPSPLPPPQHGQGWPRSWPQIYLGRHLFLPVLGGCCGCGCDCGCLVFAMVLFVFVVIFGSTIGG